MVLVSLPLPSPSPSPSQTQPRTVRPPPESSDATTPPVTPELLYQAGMSDVFRQMKRHYFQLGFLDFCDCSRFVRALCDSAATGAPLTNP